jgi:hypothetical protein
MLRAAILESLLNLLILAPLFFLARRSNKDGFHPAAALHFVLIYLVSNALTQSLAIPVFEGQNFNWVGKGAATLFLVLCTCFLPGFRREQFGLTGNIQWAGARPILALCAVYFLVRFGLYYFSGEASAAVDLETVLFQATLPGLHEELLYRGVLLGLLGAWLVRPSWRFAQVDFGWPAVITSLLFGLDHGITAYQRPRSQRQLLRSGEDDIRRLSVGSSGAEDQEHPSCRGLPQPVESDRQPLSPSGGGGARPCRRPLLGN